MKPGLRFAILRRDDFRCFYCGHTSQDGTELHVDHIVARAHGGLDVWENLVTACNECNIGKSDSRYVEAAQDYTRWSRLRANFDMVKRWRKFLNISTDDLPDDTCKKLSAILPDPREAGPRRWTFLVDYWTSDEGVADGIKLFEEFMASESERQRARGIAQ